jgi:hypothetical protein
MQNNLKRNMVVLLDLITMILSVEFLVGMYLNVYVTMIPGTIQIYEPYLFAHIILGVLLFVLSVFTVVYGHLKKVGGSITAMMILSTLLILTAGIFGMEYLITSNPLFTYLMATFFLFIFAPVGFATSLVRKIESSQVESESVDGHSST